MAELSTTPTYQCTNPDCLRTYSVDPGMCGGCGLNDFRRLDEPEPVQAPILPPSPGEHFAAAQSHPPLQAQTSCPATDCGQLNPNGQEFCDYCGNPLQTESFSGARSSVYLRADDGTRIPLIQGREVVLGRSQDASPWSRIFDGHNGVSRRHATVVFDGTQVHIRDEGSSNGTFVNRIHIDGSAALAPADLRTIGLGRNYQLSVTVEN